MMDEECGNETDVDVHTVIPRYLDVPLSRHK